MHTALVALPRAGLRPWTAVGTAGHPEDAIRLAQQESETSRDQPLPCGIPGQRRPAQTVTQPLELPAEAFTAIEQLAAQAGVPAATMIRGWILDRLSQEQPAR